MSHNFVSISFVRRKFKIILKSVGSLSMNIAPLSSRRLEIRPLSKLVKNVSFIRVNVCFEVENL